MLGLAVFLLTVIQAGCARPATGVNAATPQTEDRIEAALADGEVADALQIARDYERRVPGPEAWSYMGRALWRIGDLTAAEAFHRRSSGDGHPEGRLGLARAAAARGELAEALRLAAPTLAVESMAGRAAAFVGGVQWRLGQPAAAAGSFELGADAGDPVRTDDLRAWAAALHAVAAAGAGWTGDAAETPSRLEGAATWAEVEIGGVPARVRIDPLGWRSTITPEFAQRIGAAEDTRVFATAVRFASVAGTVPLRVAPGTAGDGVIAFDVLAGLRWIWSPSEGTFFVGTAASPREEPLFQRDLAATHWVAARTIINGLDAQLVVVPRFGARPLAAMLTLEGLSTVSLPAAQRTVAGGEFVIGGTATLLTRVGGWSAELDYRVRHPFAAIGQVPIATPVVLGPDFVNGWAWRWLPDDGQLAMVRRD